MDSSEGQPVVIVAAKLGEGNFVQVTNPAVSKKEKEEVVAPKLRSLHRPFLPICSGGEFEKSDQRKKEFCRRPAAA